MDKPTALSNAELDDLALRVKKGWVVRYDQMRALIAMARERNEIVAAAGFSFPITINESLLANPTTILHRPPIDPHCGND